MTTATATVENIIVGSNMHITTSTIMPTVFVSTVMIRSAFTKTHVESHGLAGRCNIREHDCSRRITWLA